MLTADELKANHLDLIVVVQFVVVFIVKVKLSVPLLFVCILPGKAVPEMTYTLSGGTLKQVLLLIHSLS